MGQIITDEVIFAINQRKGVLEMMSPEGLKQYLAELHVTGIAGLEPTKQQLVQAILEKMYGKDALEAYLTT